MKTDIKIVEEGYDTYIIVRGYKVRVTKKAAKTIIKTLAKML